MRPSWETRLGVFSALSETYRRLQLLHTADLGVEAEQLENGPTRCSRQLEAVLLVAMCADRRLTCGCRVQLHPVLATF